MTPREFAIEIVEKLQSAGYQALWAGGCVRDQLLGRTPKDYDVATIATPEQVQAVFGKRKTLAIGAAFGVITVVGPKSAGPIEIATFRRDGGYSDGRRPDTIEFTDAREDALRRDFTINGMFFDPIEDKVIDFVGGQEDLAANRLRAIGDPQARIAEDKLRMLRGVRFAATYELQMDDATLAAIQDAASEITVVSGERIGAEMRRMLKGRQRVVAAQMLRDSKLLVNTVSNAETLWQLESEWQQRLASLGRLKTEDFAAAATILLEPVLKINAGVELLFERWKLANDEREAMQWFLKQSETLRSADQQPWSVVQPLLLHPFAVRALALVSAKYPDATGISYCAERLKWPPNQRDPMPLLSGSDLIAMGFTPGPQFKLALTLVRQKQLDEGLCSRSAAVELAKTVLQ